MKACRRIAWVLVALVGCFGPEAEPGGANAPEVGDPGSGESSWLSAALDECGPPDGVPQVVIDELSANGAAPALGWVELHRPYGTEVVLDGWKIAGLALPAGAEAVALPAYGYLVVCGAGATVNCGVRLAGLELGGSGTVALEDAQGEGVDEAAWAAAPGSGQSWQLRHPWLDNALPGAAWAEGVWTPGARNASVWQAVESAECGDGLPCTLDVCDQGTCGHPPRPDCCTAVSQCNDSDPCTYDYCEGFACRHVSKGNTCCDSDQDCVDRFFVSECFVDTCVSGTCSHVFDAGSCCSDDLFCEAAHEDGNDCTLERCVVVDPASGLRECRNVIDPDCKTTCPYRETFDAATSLALVGWGIVDLGTAAVSNWRLETSGELGPDRFLKFGWSPTTPTVRSVAHGPKVDCHKADITLPDGDWSNVLGTSTLQFRMRYTHTQGGGPVTLRAVVSEDGGQTWATIAEWANLTGDIEYDVFSFPLPGASWKGSALQVGFQVETATTFNMDALLVDDVKVVPGVPNRFEKAVLLRCKPGMSECSNGNQYTTVCDTDPAPGSPVPACSVAAGDPLPEMNVGVCEWYKVMACFRDPDASYSTWNFFGFPAGWVEAAPLDPAAFVFNEGCFSDVGDFCPVTPDGFLCVFQFRPDCDETHAGTHRSGFVTVDEYDPGKAPHSIFESLTKFTVNVLLESGWTVWSPLGATDPSAVAIKEAVAATGRKVQVIKNLASLPDLTKYDGVIAVLGVRGRYHVVTDAEAALLATYLGAGGKVWLEGGDFFESTRQPATALHPFFKAWSRGESPGKVAGTVAGRSFLEGLSAGVSSGPLNNRNGLISRAPGTRAREVLRLEGASPAYALAVSYEDAGKGYRTVGSTFPWSGLTGDSTAILVATLDFLEHGYGAVACSDGTPCDDQDACTTDACTGGTCANTLDATCTECLDDAFMADGVTPSCDASGACVVADGRCTAIRCDGGTCQVVAGVSPDLAFSQSSPARSEVTVSDAGDLEDLQVKVRLRNVMYRGPVRVSLEAPDGRTVVLKDFDASVEADLRATYDIGVASVGALDDLATGAGGGPLPVAGTWTLVVESDPAGFPVTGRLEAWTLFASIVCGADCDACTSPTACTACNGGFLLQDGACVTTCSPAYFQSGTDCLPCEAGCTTCSSGTACTECGSGFRLAGEDCAACEANCAACSDDTTCTTCNSGYLLLAGDCVAKCLIGADLYDSGAPNPANPCQVCSPSSSTSAWTHRADGTACDDGNACTSGDTCTSGACGGTNTPVDCVVGSWSDWGACSVACGGGTQARTRAVTTPASCGGAACPALSETQSCNTQSCCTTEVCNGVDDDCDGLIDEPAQWVNPFPSTGAEGAFAPTANTVLAPGIHNFTTIDIPAGVTVTTNGSGVLDLRATGSVTIAGIIDVSGAAGGSAGYGQCYRFGGSGGATALPSGAGAGGVSACPTAGAGGQGANGQNGPGATCVAPGGAYGGGAGGGVCNGGGGGGGYAGGGGGGGGSYSGGAGASSGGTGGSGGGTRLAGGGGVATGVYAGTAGSAKAGNPSGCTTTYIGGGGGGGSIGAVAAADLPVASTFQPGSAGGGGGGQCQSCSNYGGGAGGGAGGALRIATDGTLAVSGALRANGGAGGYSWVGSGGGGGGSGGVIHLSAPAMQVNGVVSAVGGAGGGADWGGCLNNGGAGGLGRIRIANNPASCSLTGAFNPPLASGCAASGEVAGKAYVASGVVSEVLCPGGQACNSGTCAAAAFITSPNVDELLVNGNCSLREAIQAINTQANYDQCPGPGISTIALTNSVVLSINARTVADKPVGSNYPSDDDNNNANGDLDIKRPLTLVGQGVGITLSTGNKFRALDIHDVAVTVKNITFKESRATGVEGDYRWTFTDPTSDGGAIRVNGASAHLTVEDCRFDGTRAYGGHGELLGSQTHQRSGGGGGAAGQGGAIFVKTGRLTVVRSTFVNNLALGGNGSMGGDSTSTSPNPMRGGEFVAGYGAGSWSSAACGYTAENGSSGSVPGTGGGGGQAGSGCPANSSQRTRGGNGGNGIYGGGGGGGGAARWPAPGTGAPGSVDAVGGSAGSSGGWHNGNNPGAGSGGGGAGFGGAIACDGCTLVVRNSTFTNNVAAGGIGGTSINSGGSGGAGIGIGGAIFVWVPPVAPTFENVTYSGNTANVDANYHQKN